MGDDPFKPRTHEEYLRKAEESLAAVNKLAEPEEVAVVVAMAQVFATLAVATKPNPWVA